MGKTLLALQIAMNQAMAEIPVVFFTMEMSADQLTQRMLSNLGTMDGAAFLKPDERITTEQFLTLAQKADQLKGKPLYIVDLHQANLDRIEGEIANAIETRAANVIGKGQGQHISGPRQSRRLARATARQGKSCWPLHLR